MFPRPVCVPVANGLVGFTPCLTSFRPSFMLTQPHTETTRADWESFDKFSLWESGFEDSVCSLFF